MNERIMQRRARWTAALGFVSVVALMMFGMSWRGTSAAHAATNVRLAAREFTYLPKELVVQSGDVMFLVRNDGAIEHNFVLEDQTKRSATTIPIIEPGDSSQVRVTLPPGTYTIYCGLPGHREAGMTATLKVQ
jgi:uncharacterized cupredoxin-like copper-binding protein